MEVGLKLFCQWDGIVSDLIPGGRIFRRQRNPAS